MSSDTDTTAVRVYPCDTWDDFSAAIRRTRLMPKNDPDDKTNTFGSGVIFRGHSDPSWRLSSTVDRRLLIDGEVLRDGIPMENPSLKSMNGREWYESECTNLIERFRRFSAGMPGIPDGLSDLEMWAIGRHYGLLSPYLDWTGSPYIAAFFAFEKIYQAFEFTHSNYQTMPDRDVVHVWGLRLWTDLERNGEFEVDVIEAPHSSRPRAQQAWFTRLDAIEFSDLQSYLESRDLAFYLERYDLNTEMAMHTLRDLELMNINYLSVFPDAVGAALHSNINSDLFRLALAMAETNESDR